MGFNGFLTDCRWVGAARLLFLVFIFLLRTGRPRAALYRHWTGPENSVLFSFFFSFHANKTTNFTSISVVGQKQSETPLRRRKISVSTVIWPSLFEDCVEMDSRDLKKTRHFCDCNGIFFLFIPVFFFFEAFFPLFCFLLFFVVFFWMRGRPFPCRGPTPSFTGVRWRPAL